MILATGLLRIPLPQADYHAIRHEHGPGEICARHDHLLRWHPGTGQEQTAAVLHWHWFVPSAEQPDRDAGRDGQSAAPALHAHADGLEPDWTGDLIVQAVPQAPHSSSRDSAAASPAPHLSPSLTSLLEPPQPPESFSPPREATASPNPPPGLSPRRNC